MSEPTGSSRDDQPNDPLAEIMRQLGLTPGSNGQFDLNQLMARMQQQMAAFTQNTGASGVNWEQTRHAARQVVAQLGPDPSPVAAQQTAVADAERLANLWLDEACDMAQVPTRAVAWSRAEWVENTMAAWQQVSEPVVTSLARAMGELTQGQAGGLPPELGALGAMMQPVMRQAAGAMYSMQLAQAIASMASKVVTGSEIGMQLLAQPRVALLPTNIDAFAEGLEGVSEMDVQLYLTLREAARQRLFNQVAWLGPQMLALVEHYAREITIDASALESAIDIDDMSQLGPEKFAEISEKLQGKLFEPTQTAEQEEILGRLENLLALVEGWVDEVVAQASARWMPNSSQLAEAVRRRRAAGGPSQETFKQLFGLELRPRRVRDAANLWAALTADRGLGGRDAVWNHPDLIPTGADLDDPLGYVSGESREQQVDDLDAELAKLLAEHGDQTGGVPEQQPGKPDGDSRDDDPDEGPGSPAS